MVAIARSLTIAKVAETLGSKISTLRNYCKLLEDKGYIFERDVHNHRLFSDTDIAILSELLNQLKDKSNTREMALEQALLNKKEVVKSVNDNADIATLSDINMWPHVDMLTDISKSMEYMAEHIHGLQKEIVKLREDNMELTKENKKIIEQNGLLQDQLTAITNLLTSPKEDLKEQQQIHALMSEVRKLNVQLSELKNPKEQPTKKWWSKFFNK